MRLKVGMYVYYTLLISVILCLVQQFLLIRDHLLNQYNSCNFLSETETILPSLIKNNSSGDHDDASKNENDNHHNLATKILTGKVSLDEKDELKFTPGSLHLEMRDVLKHCYADTEIYKNHFPGGWENRLVSISEKYKLIYILVAKSGSSTSRFMMDKRFEAGDGVVYKSQMELEKASKEQNYTVFTFMRDPLSRFWSGYEEAWFRTSPFNRHDNPFFDNGKRPHPYPFLHEGIKEFDDYQNIWCPPDTIKDKFNPGRECSERQTMENGTLAARLERFVKEMDIRSPIDVHLKLQVPMLSNSKTGYFIDLDKVYSVADTTEAWENISESHGVNLSDPIPMTNHMRKKDTTGVIKGRSFPRRFDKSRISNETKQRVCEHELLDYCCMNMPLPPPCDNLYCKLNHGEEKDGKKRLQVQAWSIPTL